MQPRSGQVIEKQPKIIGYEVDRPNPEGRDGVAAVHSFAKPEKPSRRRDLRAAYERLSAHDGRQHFELRQRDAEIAAEQPAPCAAGEYDLLARDPALFGYHRRDASTLRFDAACGALGHDRRAVPPRRLGDRRRRPLRLGFAVARGIERTRPVAGQTGHQLRRFGTGEYACVELILAGMLEPALELP